MAYPIHFGRGGLLAAVTARRHPIPGLRRIRITDINMMEGLTAVHTMEGLIIPVHPIRAAHTLVEDIDVEADTDCSNQRWSERAGSMLRLQDWRH